MQKDKKEHKKEDTTKYGEFVCSTYHWLPIEKQKEQVEKIEQATRNKKDNRKKIKLFNKKIIFELNF